MLLTTSEVAYARLVANEHQRCGAYDMPHAKAAAIIGCCPETVRRAQRRLEQLGLISVEHRPVQGRKHMSNVIRIVDASWLSWIDNGPAPRPYPIAQQLCLPTINQSYDNSATRTKMAAKQTLNYRSRDDRQQRLAFDDE
jgi:hypothetical protein